MEVHFVNNVDNVFAASVVEFFINILLVEIK